MPRRRVRMSRRECECPEGRARHLRPHEVEGAQAAAQAQPRAVTGGGQETWLGAGRRRDWGRRTNRSIIYIGKASSGKQNKNRREEELREGAEGRGWPPPGVVRRHAGDDALQQPQRHAGDAQPRGVQDHRDLANKDHRDLAKDHRDLANKDHIDLANKDHRDQAKDHRDLAKDHRDLTRRAGERGAETCRDRGREGGHGRDIACVAPQLPK